MDLRGFDKKAKIVLAAGLDWWNSMSLELLSDIETTPKQRVKAERELALGKELYLELTGNEWYNNCPYLFHLEIVEKEDEDGDA
jgi:hypothetical protein